MSGSRREADRSDELRRLREIEARYRRLTQHARDIIAEIDGDGRFLFISPSCEEVLGYRVAELEGRSLRDAAILDRLHPDDRARVGEVFRQALAGEATGGVIYRYCAADGTWRWFESKGATFDTDGGGWRSVVISREVTDREEALARLRHSEERYRVLSETTRDLVAELDAEGRLMFISPACVEVLGYEPSELEGTTPFSLVHPDDVERLAQLFLRRLGADHQPRHREVFRVRHRDGAWRWLQGGGVNIRTASGETHIVCVCRDVTDLLRQADERRRLEERVRRAQQVETLATVAGGVAHDFNNLLTPILGEASLALMDLSPDSAARPRLEKIQRAAHHAATLTRQLLDYAGIGLLDSEPIDLSKLVREMGELVEGSISRHARLRLELPPGVSAVDGDAAQLSQVVLNLINNACEAIEARREGRREIRVRSLDLELDRSRLSRLLLGEELPAGRYAAIEVEDEGIGMDAETRARIFDPFFTTKFTGRGLGLAAVLGIVRKHRGAIEIESEPGRGTRIRVLLPATRESLPAPDRSFRQLIPEQTPATVLVADDDEGARELVVEILHRAGYEVVEAADGKTAVEAFRKAAGRVSLVVLDRTMPVAGGEEAVEAIRRLRPEVPILLMSGYSLESTEMRSESLPADGFIQKPFLPEVLVERVRDLIEN